MTFKLYTDTGKEYGPYGSLVLAQKEARGKFAGDKRIKAVEVRPSCSAATGGYGLKHQGSFYKARKDL